MNDGAETAGTGNKAEASRPMQASVETRKLRFNLNPGSGNSGRTFYLVRNGDNWNLTLTPQDVNRADVERFTYWPGPKEFSATFDERRAKTRTGHLRCHANELDRAKMGYTPCTTSFKKPQGVTGARVLAGVLSVGASELSGAISYDYEVDRVTAIVNAFDLERQLNLHDYRAEFQGAGNRSRLLAFISKYAVDDPDGLLVKAKERLATLDENRSILNAVEYAVQSLAVYTARYTPANPERYCDSLKKESAVYERCRKEAANIVATLAARKAQETRRLDICTGVSRRVSGAAQASLCIAYKTESTCSGASTGESRTCDILNQRGQS